MSETLRGSFSALDSFDADQRGLSRSDIQEYEWRLDGVLQGERGELVQLAIPPGFHEVAVTVVDTFGAFASASLLVEAEDAAAPEGTLAVTVGRPGLDGLRDVHVEPRVMDACGGDVAAILAGVTPDPGTRESCVVEGADLGTADLDFRAACAGYTATYELRDASGNVSTLRARVEAR